MYLGDSIKLTDDMDARDGESPMVGVKRGEEGDRFYLFSVQLFLMDDYKTDWPFASF